MKKIPQDIIGNIAILKFPRRTLWITKKLRARKFLKLHPKVTTVVEKTEKFSGKLRIPTTKYLAGEKTYIAHYKENDCTFKFNINKTYFSPRLSNERKVIADEVAKIVAASGKRQAASAKSKTFRILVMFAGISPYPIVIARKLKQKNKTFHIYANELNKQANISAKENIRLNKLQKNITLISGNANKISTKQKFDIILMPRPNLKETFLIPALKLSKKGTIIFYHGFGTKEEVLNEIKKDTKEKIGKVKIRKAGDIGPYKFRWQAIFKVK
jgi:tRNA (guanine37-N1)-methyltransferase